MTYKNLGSKQTYSSNNVLKSESKRKLHISLELALEKSYTQPGLDLTDDEMVQEWNKVYKEMIRIKWT